MARVVDLAALEQVEEDVQRRGPCAGAHGRARLGQGLGDGETIPPIIGDARHQGALAAEIDAQHLRTPLMRNSECGMRNVNVCVTLRTTSP